MISKPNANLPDLADQVELAIKKFEHHPSIKTIKQNICLRNNFFFKTVNNYEVSEEIANLNNSKQGTFGNIPTKIIKDTTEICTPILVNIWNKTMLKNYVFETNLKTADITPVFKKKDRTLVENYRPISVLPTKSKIVLKKMVLYIENCLSPYLCG